MLIDWTTVIFQLINFLILIVLLKRFLYGPIIRAMDERERTIAARLAEASRAEQEAQEHARVLAAEQKEFADRRAVLHDEAQQELDRWKDQSLDRLKEEVAAKQQSWQQTLDEEQETFRKKLKVVIGQQVFSVSRKVLADLADNRLERRLLEVFLEKISREAEGFSGDQGSVTIRSGFPLVDEEKKRLDEGLDKIFPGHGALDFQEDPALGFGLRLLTGDRQWEWNLSRYLDDMEEDIIQTLRRSP
ncbi:MAG: hypothetical protein KJ950_17510 [Proteobacteria bacterium]|nr:hypothetical protein [Pseudomonadota bacterium]MBU1689058.1 hypothetical protein [Pseudomonadota bacterium]